jgi:hypothetical protein
MNKPIIIETLGYHEPTGLWIFKDCAINADNANEVILIPASGKFTHDGDHYQLGESISMVHLHQPAMFVNDPAAELADIQSRPELYRWSAGQIFDKTSNRFLEMFGGGEGLLVLGTALAYTMAPELLEAYHGHPGIWIVGKQGSGKSAIADIIMRLWGFKKKHFSLSLTQGTTSAALDRALADLSNIPVHLNNHSESFDLNHTSPIRAAYNRQQTAKRSSMGSSTQISRAQTSPLITGLSATPDQATLSRYVYCVLESSRPARLLMDEMMMEKLHHIVRYILMNRTQMAKYFIRNFRELMSDESWICELSGSRLAITYGAPLAMIRTLATHFNVPIEYASLRKFTKQYALSTTLGSEVEPQKPNRNLHIYHFAGGITVKELVRIINMGKVQNHSTDSPPQKPEEKEPIPATIPIHQCTIAHLHKLLRIYEASHPLPEITEEDLQKIRQSIAPLSPGESQHQAVEAIIAEGERTADTLNRCGIPAVAVSGIKLDTEEPLNKIAAAQCPSAIHSPVDKWEEKHRRIQLAEHIVTMAAKHLAESCSIDEKLRILWTIAHSPDLRNLEDFRPAGGFDQAEASTTDSQPAAPQEEEDQLPPITNGSPPTTHRKQKQEHHDRKHPHHHRHPERGGVQNDSRLGGAPEGRGPLLSP